MVTRKVSSVIAGSAARIATLTTAIFDSAHVRGIIFIMNVAALGAASTLTLKVKGIDPISGNTYDILVDGAAIAAAGTYAFVVAPSVGAPANGIRASVATELPQSFTVEVVHNNANACTYSISAVYLP